MSYDPLPRCHAMTYAYLILAGSIMGLLLAVFLIPVLVG